MNIKFIKVVQKLLVISLFTTVTTMTLNAKNNDGINQALIGSYSCKKGRKSGRLQLSASGNFKYMSRDNFRGYEGKWESTDGDKSLGDIITKVKMSNGKYMKQSHNYQKKGNNSLVIFFDENVFNSTTTCKFSRKETSI